MNKNKKLNEYGFVHLSLIIIIVLSVAVVGLAGYRVNEARTASRAKSNLTTDGQQSKLNNNDTKQDELTEEALPDEQISQSDAQAPEPQAQTESEDEPEPTSSDPRQIFFVKGGQSTEGDNVELTHIMTEAHSGTCKFTFSLNGTIRVEKTTQISGSKTCSVIIPKSEFPKSAEYSEVTRFTSNDGSVYAETQPYGILVI
jgi:cytoskeletal protein RodZ